jgi:hypothetical protein
MGRQQQKRVGTKTCPACGGTWPADRRNCLACGANLESVPAQSAASEGQGQEPIDWAWLDAMADEGTTPGKPQPAENEQKPGCLGRIFPK